MSTTASPADLARLVAGSVSDPHAILGAHPTGDGRTVIRTLRPEATAVDVIIGRTTAPLRLVHDGGVYEAIIDGKVPDYRLRVSYGQESHTVDDPYRWLPTLGDIDLHLIGEGRHENLWEVLGAHVRSYETPGGRVTGTSFAVWAPNARGVRVFGDFDYWSGRALPMRVTGLFGCLGAVRPGRRRRAALQVPDPRRGRRLAREGRPVGVRHRDAAGDGVGGAHAALRRGPTTPGSSGGRRRNGTPPRCRSTRCTSAHGALAWATSSWRASSSTTSARPGSPTSSCCRLRSTPSAARGATRSPPTTHRPRASAPRTSSGTLSTRCTTRASA